MLAGLVPGGQGSEAGSEMRSIGSPLTAPIEQGASAERKRSNYAWGNIEIGTDAAIYEPAR